MVPTIQDGISPAKPNRTHSERQGQSVPIELRIYVRADTLAGDGGFALLKLRF